MNATRMLVALLIAATGVGLARGQTADVNSDTAPAPAATPTELLTEKPTPSPYPEGTYTSPWCGPHGCTGPVGANGPLTYELYSINGVTMPVGGSELSGAMKVGWTTGGGARSLWFRQDHTAAWVFDLGLTYTYNQGQQDKFLNVGTPRVSPIVVDPFTGIQTGGERIFPDGIATYRLRHLNRTNFNFALGRDWWLNGPASVMTESAGNTRVGADIGGRWGTSTAILVPVLDQGNFLKGGSTTHSIFIGMHMGWERPVGAWILTCGLRAEWGYTFSNVVAPLGADVHDVSLLMTFGARF